MSKKRVKVTKRPTVQQRIIGNETALLSRLSLISELLNPNRDIDTECGYPVSISADMYRRMYDRGDIAQRVVKVYPEESWAQDPEIYETEETEKTEFEEAWDELLKKHNLLYNLAHADDLSGIGRFGLLLLGFDGEPETPVPGVDLTGEVMDPEAPPTGEADPTKLLYLRAFDETCVRVDVREPNPASPRFGKPISYTITMKDEDGNMIGGGGAAVSSSVISRTLKVHWTRVLHLADNCVSSPVYGTPRMQVVFNALLDHRKIRAGSGEMFWKGAFPGISLEQSPNTAPNATLDTESIKEQMELYMNGLQRYMAFTGLNANSLSPTVASPADHTQVQIDTICITLGVPKRIFMGSERGELASSQDQRAWNNRVLKRQLTYLTPMVIRPLVDRLMQAGVLPTIDEFFVDWPDLNTVTDLEKAQVAVSKTAALAQYVSGGVDALVPPKPYMTTILGMPTEEVEQILEEAEEHQEVRDEQKIHDAEMQKEANDAMGLPEPGEEKDEGGFPPKKPAFGKEE